MTDPVRMIVDGKVYAGWTDMRVSRGLDRCCADFTLSVGPRWPGLTADWLVLPFAAIEIALGDDTVLTGYADRFMPEISATSRDAKVSGRSKTCDLVDCTPEIGGTEFRRSTLPAVCRALCAPFKIEVVEAVDCGGTFALEAMERGDTAWQTIERLCRMRGVLACDDGRGRLVLTRAVPETRASGALVQGENVLTAQARLDGGKRFSRYIVLSQQPSAAALDREGDGDADDEAPEERPGGGASPAIGATAEDPDVPRYRPRVIRAEGNGGAADAQARARWAAATARAKSVTADVTVQGWRQPDGRLWQAGEIVPVRIPYLALDRDMAVLEVSYLLGVKAGRTTELVLTPPEALLPEPLKASGTGSGGGGGIWGPRGTFATERRQ